MIRRCDQTDFEVIWQIINDGAQAYHGVIPQARWKEPYMSRAELATRCAKAWSFGDMRKRAS